MSSAPKRSPIRDRVAPTDWRNLPLIRCCEQCSHFDESNAKCTLGYESKWHQREAQNRQYELSGSIYLCRFLEID